MPCGDSSKLRGNGNKKVVYRLTKREITVSVAVIKVELSFEDKILNAL